MIKKRNTTGKQRLPWQYRKRTYRQRVHCDDMVSFQVASQETDLMIQADLPLDQEARESVLLCRSQIEGYIQRYPDFVTRLVPWSGPTLAPPIVRAMIDAGAAAGVGPMAAVAGAVAQTVGKELLAKSRRVVVENGGDIFLLMDRPIVAALFAGNSPVSMKLGIRIPAVGDGMGLCTSSASVGHSLSTGIADAVCVLSPSCAVADAAATAIGNRVDSPRRIKTAIDFGSQIDGVLGIVVVAGKELGAWGQVELVPLQGKKG